nr:MAG TPA: hypothetical protein [Caudoviricetes sp.]
MPFNLDNYCNLTYIYIGVKLQYFFYNYIGIYWLHRHFFVKKTSLF